MSNTRTPLIFCNKKQVGFDYSNNKSDIISVSATSAIPGYNWVFNGVPSANVVTTDLLSSSSISFRISGKEFVSHEDGNSSSISISWQLSSTPINTAPTGAYDRYYFIIRNYEALPSTYYPETVYEPIRLPIPLNDILIGSNEVAESSAINTSISKLHQNFEYLIDKSEYVSSSLWITSRYGRSNAITSADSIFQWNDITYIPTETSADAPPFYWGYDHILSATHVAVKSDAMCYVINSSILAAGYTISGYIPTIYTRAYPVFNTSPFSDILSIDMDETGLITVLESSGRISSLRFTNGTWTYVSSSTSFVEPIINPTNMSIRDGIIYISTIKSATNRKYVIKAYDRDLNFIREFTNDNIVSISSIAITRDYLVSLVVDTLGAQSFYIFDKNTANFVKAVAVGNTPKQADKATRSVVNGSLQKIFNATDDYMFFANSENMVHQYTQDGLILYTGNDSIPPALLGNPQYDSESTSGNNIIYDLTGIAQDSNYNIFASSNCDIIKYYGRPTHRSRIINSPYFDFESSLWSLPELSIGSNENCSYWVYNRVFNRFMDNLNIYLESLTGKLVISDTYADIVGFGPSELIPFTHPKDSIFVGINELHCDAAINRNIRKLYANLEICAAYGKVQSTETIPGEEIFWDGTFTFNNIILFGGR